MFYGDDHLMDMPDDDGNIDFAGGHYHGAYDIGSSGSDANTDSDTDSDSAAASSTGVSSSAAVRDVPTEKEEIMWSAAAQPTSTQETDARNNNYTNDNNDTSDMRPPTSNGLWDADDSTMETMYNNPLAESALELYITHDGVAIGDVALQLRQLGLILPSDFSLDTYFSAVSDDDDDENGGTAGARPRAALPPSTMLSPEEWLCVVRDVWAVTQPQESPVEPSPQPAHSNDGLTSEGDRDDGGPAFVDATAKKKQMSVSLDPPTASPDDQNSHITNNNINANVTVASTHYVSNVSSSRRTGHVASPGAGDVSGIQPTPGSHYNSDSADLLRQLFPPGTNSAQPVSAPDRTALTTTTTTTANSVNPSSTSARPRPSKVTSCEDAARELFVLSGAIPLHVPGQAPATLHLTVGGWEHTIRLHNHGKLPPQPIVDDATRTIAALGAAAASVTDGRTGSTAAALFNSSLGQTSSLSALLAATGGGHRPIAFAAFYALLMDQLRQVMGDLANGHFTSDAAHQRVYHSPEAPPPTLLLVLAAIAPTEVELLAGAPALAYLRAVGAVDAATRALVIALEEEIVHRVRAAQRAAATNGSDPTRSLALSTSAAGAGGAVGRPSSAQLPEELNWQDDRDRMNGTSSTSLVPSVPRPASASRQQLNGRGGSRRPLTGSSTGRSSGSNRNSRHLQRPDSAATVRSRFREERPLDEISASVVARAKARRLLDTLRRQTVPINRYEWYVRAEAEAPPLETNFLSGMHTTTTGDGTDDGEISSSDSDAMPNMEEALTLKVGPRAGASATTGGASSPYSTLIGAPERKDVTALYRLGGVITVSVTPKAHQATFDRLSKPRCDPRLLSGVSHAPRLSAARRAAVLRRRQEQEQQGQQQNLDNTGTSEAVQGPRLPPPRLYTVPPRAGSTDVAVDTSINTSTMVPNVSRNGEGLQDVRPKPKTQRTVAYELSYGSADDGDDVDDDINNNRDDGVARRARRHHRRRRAPPPRSGGASSSSRHQRFSPHQRSRSGRSRSHTRGTSAASSSSHGRRAKTEVASAPSRTPYSTTARPYAQPLNVSYPSHAAGADLERPRRPVKGTRPGVRRHRGRSRPPPVVPPPRAESTNGSHDDAAPPPHPRHVPERPSEDPYPYRHPVAPPTSHEEEPPLAKRQSPMPEAHRTGGLGGRHPLPAPMQPPRREANEKLSKFQNFVTRRFSNTGEENTVATPELSADTASTAESASFASYDSTPDKDRSVDHSLNTSSDTQHREKRLTREQEERYSTSFPSLSAAATGRTSTSQAVPGARRTSLPRRVLAPLLVSSSSRLPSEMRPGSGSRVEPLDPLMFTASSVHASGGRPPLTPMGPSSSSTHRR